MLTALCKELKNWFDVERYFGEFTIKNGTLDSLSDLLQDGQYYRIVGSVFNDGVYQYAVDDAGLHDEVFRGSVWAMAVPPEVVELANDIQAWNDKYGSDEQANSPYQSESFGGYSYTKSGSGTGDGNDTSTWQGHFKGRLNQWRKI